MKKIKSKILKFVRKIFFNNVTIRPGAKVTNSRLYSYAAVSKGAIVTNSTIDEFSSIGRNSTVINSELGKFCSISWNVTIGATQHSFDRCSSHAFPYIQQFDFVKEDRKIITKTTIGNDVWIGANAVIMPGVSVGDGAIIGAGSVVTKNVTAYSIVAGVPAKTIRRRFSQDTINKLLDIEWWKWDRELLKENINLFQKNLNSEILESFEKINQENNRQRK